MRAAPELAPKCLDPHEGEILEAPDESKVLELTFSEKGGAPLLFESSVADWRISNGRGRARETNYGLSPGSRISSSAWARTFHLSRSRPS